MNTLISKYFTLQDATKSQTAIRYGIDNNPSKNEIERIKLVAQNILDVLMDAFPNRVSVSSFYRSIKVNKEIGGSKSSQHCKGEAVDVEVIGMDNKELFLWCYHHLDFDQLISEFYIDGEPTSGWVHCSYRKIGNRKQCLKAYREREKTHYVLLNMSKEVAPEEKKNIIDFGKIKLSTNKPKDN